MSPATGTDRDVARLRASRGQAVWDLLVAGGGTAGMVAATTAAGLGARVLLVERDRTGGDCLWTGCVPSKALLAAAATAASARSAERHGIRVGRVDVDFPAVMAHVRQAIEHIAPVDSPQALEAEGVTVRQGTVCFTGRGTAEVDGDPVTFRQAVLATGAAPSVPSVPGLDAVDPLTSETVWDLEALPPSLVVLGGGSIGCELGQGFARLGAEVTLVEAAPRLLPEEDPRAAAAVRRALEGEGVRVRTGVSVSSVRAAGPDARAGHLVVGAEEVPFDRLLLAVGRSPRTVGLGLHRLGVETDEHGFVKVDDHLRTTNRRVWAAGDLTGHPQFTHVAGVHGSVAALNAVLGLSRSVDRSVVPRVTYTQPEVAAVGLATADPGPGLRVLTWAHSHVDRAVAEGQLDGETRLVVDRRGRIRGATVVGPRAGETLGELGVAVKQRLRTGRLAQTTHAYPTWNDGAWNAAIEDLRRQLDQPMPRRALRAVALTRRWWLDHRSP